MKRNSNPFKRRHFEPAVILLCVRWYCPYQLSYRDVEEMMRERGLDIDHSTVFRWAWTKKGKPSNLCSAQGETFTMWAEHRRLPFSISVDKNTAYPQAFSTSQVERIVPPDCKLRRVRYLNNVIEQDHRFIRKKVRASQCSKRFHTTERTPEGIEAVNLIRRGQVKRLAGSDSQGQAKFVASLFGIAAQQKLLEALLRLRIIFATYPNGLLPRVLY